MPAQHNQATRSRSLVRVPQFSFCETLWRGCHTSTPAWHCRSKLLRAFGDKALDVIEAEPDRLRPLIRERRPVYFPSVRRAALAVGASVMRSRRLFY